MAEFMAWRGLCEHGAVRAICVDNPERKTDVAKELSSYARYGFSVDRVSLEDARKSNMNCLVCDEKHLRKRTKKA